MDSIGTCCLCRGGADEDPALGPLCWVATAHRTNAPAVARRARPNPPPREGRRPTPNPARDPAPGRDADGSLGDACLRHDVDGDATSDATSDVESDLIVRGFSPDRPAPLLDGEGALVLACGHVAHAECHARYLTAAESRDAEGFAESRARVGLADGDFHCPTCRRMCNALVPIATDPPCRRRRVWDRGDETGDDDREATPSSSSEWTSATLSRDARALDRTRADAPSANATSIESSCRILGKTFQMSRNIARGRRCVVGFARRRRRVPPRRREASTTTRSKPTTVASSGSPSSTASRTPRWPRDGEATMCEATMCEATMREATMCEATMREATMCGGVDEHIVDEHIVDEHIVDEHIIDVDAPASSSTPSSSTRFAEPAAATAADSTMARASRVDHAALSRSVISASSASTVSVAGRSRTRTLSLGSPATTRKCGRPSHYVRPTRYPVGRGLARWEKCAADGPSASSRRKLVGRQRRNQSPRRRSPEPVPGPERPSRNWSRRRRTRRRMGRPPPPPARRTRRRSTNDRKDPPAFVAEMAWRYARASPGCSPTPVVWRVWTSSRGSPSSPPSREPPPRRRTRPVVRDETPEVTRRRK